MLTKIAYPDIERSNPVTGFGRKKQSLAVREKRRSDRSITNVGATLVTTASSQPVSMLDFSSEGVGLHGSPPSLGRDVQIKVDNVTLFGAVAWRKNDTFGLKFDRLLEDQALADLSSAVEIVEEAGYYREPASALRDLANDVSD